jgi:predicted RNase H-related nuclease YkuK (DUF458 family)
MDEIKLNFKKVDGTNIENVEEYVKNWVACNPWGTITIGCDSQVHGRRIKYATVICMHFIDRMGQGHGAHVIVADTWEKRMNNKSQVQEMPSKLWREAEFVLTAAQMVDGGSEFFKKKITIHLDYNSIASANSHANLSNMLFDSGLGYLTGQGYKAEGKPHAWAATHTADALCR